MLYSAIVHECDRILRNNADSPSPIRLPTEFHYLYAMSLKHVGSLKDRQAAESNEKPQKRLEILRESLDFYNVALERLEQANECEEVSVEKWAESDKIVEAMCLILFEKVLKLFLLLNSLIRKETITAKLSEKEWNFDIQVKGETTLPTSSNIQAALKIYSTLTPSQTSTKLHILSALINCASQIASCKERSYWYTFCKSEFQVAVKGTPLSL